MIRGSIKEAVTEKARCGQVLERVGGVEGDFKLEMSSQRIGTGQPQSK